MSGLLGQLDRRDATLAGDRSAARAAQLPQGPSLVSESRLGRALAGLLAGTPMREPAGIALVVGVSHPEVIEGAARAAHTCVALAHSRRAAQAARAFIERRGLSCRVLEAAASGSLTEAEMGRVGGPFALVVLDQPAAEADILVRTLSVAGRALLPHGRLWIFETYEALESSRQRVVEHPLARLRRVLAEAQLACERLSPVEADGAHVLAAVARRADAMNAGTAAGAA